MIKSKIKHIEQVIKNLQANKSIDNYDVNLALKYLKDEEASRHDGEVTAFLKPETVNNLYNCIKRVNNYGDEISVTPCNAETWEEYQPGCYIDNDINELVDLVNDAEKTINNLTIIPNLDSESHTFYLSNEDDPEELRKLLSTAGYKINKYKSDFENKIVIDYKTNKYCTYTSRYNPRYEFDFQRDCVNFYFPDNHLESISFSNFLILAKLAKVIIEKNELAESKRLEKEFIDRVGGRKIIFDAIEYIPGITAHPRSNKIPFWFKELLKNNYVTEISTSTGSRNKEKCLLQYNDDKTNFDLDPGDYLAISKDCQTKFRIPKEKIDNYYIYLNNEI